MASLYEKQIARNQATKDFRTKWGGVISPKYTEGADLASNKFVGTASQKDVIESLLSSGTSGNLAVWVKENKIDVDSLADTYTMSSWKTPIKQTALREELALQKISEPEDLKKAWTSEKMKNLREKHLNGQYSDIPQCKNCVEGGIE